MHKRIKYNTSSLFVDEDFECLKNCEKDASKQNLNCLVFDCLTVSSKANCINSKEKDENSMTNVAHSMYAYDEDEFTVATTITQSQASNLKENKSCSSGIESFSAPSTSTCVLPHYKIFTSNNFNSKSEPELNEAVKNW